MFVSLSLIIAVIQTVLCSHITIDDIGVMKWPDESPISINNHRLARELIDSFSCAEETYSSGCSGTDPEGCTCTALTDTEKTQILDAHNERRELAAAGQELCATSSGSGTEACPAATDMNSMIWDDQLETIATYWAHQLYHLYAVHVQ